MTDRFFIDERVGCIAIRDRTLTDQGYPGLHFDTEGVVFYRAGAITATRCEHCGNLGSSWGISSADRAAAILECARLNAVHATSPEIETVWGTGP